MAATTDLCIEWRQIGKQAWNYATGTRGKSRGELTRLMVGFKDSNAAFEFRIRPFAIGHANHCSKGGNMSTLKELQTQLREIRREMKEQGIRKTSCMNGGLSSSEFNYNRIRWELETKIADAKRESQ